MRDTERERERERQRHRQGEAGPMQGARCGTRFRVSRITPWAEGGAKPLSHPGCPDPHFLSSVFFGFYSFSSFFSFFYRERKNMCMVVGVGKGGRGRMERQS